MLWELTGYRNPHDVDLLPNGNYLITERGTRVVEVDKTGRVIWKKESLRSPSDADRLDNGNTLITESGANRVIELSPDGNIVREIKGLGFPGEANRR
jgi:hypothetical protein